MIYAEGCGLSLSEAEEAAPVITVESLVPAYTPLLFRMAHAVLRNRAEADDVVQETFLRVVQHRMSLPDVRDMRVWLVRIAWNLALDRRRKLRPDQMEDAFAQSLVSAELPADRAVAEALELKAVLAEIERLPKAERHVLLLAAVEEMNHAEMAAVLGRSESAVRALLFRARTRLRERLNRRSAR
ncbi:RNA polymerase sigma factor, sigma-70 family [Terriglobus roseus DSM 18391]|uniref:RNA polymerase sigma factor, sigma-70 family n=1 Tax=Terriglobus roseus (strain DSM 18391 / NRRL B-41598 / KBS 63) TaxID=926566 RepID=I3ZM17_TERRK|nr:sigma-70 family RNA polymerase sigma factor [Terriglobus roseus]AFL90285.1 RNA polymerase sigma factor, sigma-70 family [Terriglobus roseus DSM 18391]